MDDGACRLIEGDCREWLPGIESGTVDAVIADPPYPCIKRSYGTLTEAEWHELMRVVVGECRRILKPSGSAVFILQPNSERVGRMRLWLWEFMVWAGREWGIVQDAWWWNIQALPCGGAITAGLMRSSLKACVWLGDPGCYRNQDEVLWSESDEGVVRRKANKARPGIITTYPSGRKVDRARILTATVIRGGTTPFNVIPVRGATEDQSRLSGRHPALTPDPLADWWVRYISPVGGLVCDPFVGSGTTALAALKQGRSFVGGDKMPEYVATARNRVEAARAATPLFA
jgi:DNA modification methylase